MASSLNSLVTPGAGERAKVSWLWLPGAGGGTRALLTKVATAQHFLKGVAPVGVCARHWCCLASLVQHAMIEGRQGACTTGPEIPGRKIGGPARYERVNTALKDPQHAPCAQHAELREEAAWRTLWLPNLVRLQSTKSCVGLQWRQQPGALYSVAPARRSPPAPRPPSTHLHAQPADALSKC